MRCHNLLFTIMIMLGFCLSCAEQKVESTENQLSMNAMTSTDILFEQTTALKNRGHVIFKVDPNDVQSVAMKSLQQPAAVVKKLSDYEFVLSDLLPQKHTLVAEKTVNGEKQFSVFGDLEVEANKYVEIGLLTFQKSGAVRGRLLSADSALAVAQVKVTLPELSVSALSTSSGEFFFKDLPYGKWKLIAVSALNGHQMNTSINVVSGESTSVGDIWLGDSKFSGLSAELVNGMNNITSEPKAKFKFKFPPGTRFVTIKSKEGEIFLNKVVARQNLEFDLSDAIKTVFDILVYDDSGKLMGVTQVFFQYDPFSDSGKQYEPQIKVLQRVLKSPQRTISVDLSARPAKAQKVRFGIDNVFNDWVPVADSMVVEVPKNNLSCGQRTLNFQFETGAGHESAVSSLPVTLSCWERIPNRAALDKLVGIDNASVWTGTHAFVWSGRQFTFGNRSGPWGGSNSFETVQHLEKQQTYQYLDGGYVYRPVHNADKTALVSDMEFIVTDNAPNPRALAGIAGRDHLVAIYGGENASGPLADGAIFDINNNGWVSMIGPGAPSARIKPSVFFLDEKRVLVWGGRTRTNLGYEMALNDGAIYNLQTHQWSPISAENAPTPRFSHIGIQVGTKFYVFGGHLAGGVDVMSAGIYDSATNTWQALALDFSTASMSAIAANDNIIFFGRNKLLKILNLRDWSVSAFPVLGNNKWMIESQMVLDGDGTGPTGSFLYIYGGRNSTIETDASDEFLRLVYRYNSETGQGTIDNGDSRTRVFAAKDAFGSPVAFSYYPVEKCCLNSLGFASDKFLFVMNATVSINTSLSQPSKFAYFGGGDAGSNYTEIFPVTLTNVARRFTYNETTGNLSAASVDTPLSAGWEGRSPYYLYRTDPPVWNPQNRTLMFYGGIYKHLDAIKTAQGGYLYNVDSKSWSRLPAATFESKQYDYTFWSWRYNSRNDSLRFLIDGQYFILGGFYHYVSGSTSLYMGLEGYKGIKLTLNNNVPNVPEQINLSSSAFDFYMFSNNAFYGSDQFRMNAPCTVGSQVLLSGGIRRYVRSPSNIVEQSSALLQDKVIFDASTSSLRKASDGPLGVRGGLTAVSTGNECFLWGGYTADSAIFSTNVHDELKLSAMFQGTGATYSFESNEWTELPTEGAPSPRALMHGVWTGKDVLLWGGSRQTEATVATNNSENKGVWRYNPTSRKWMSQAPAAGEPPFTGTEVPVWLGHHLFIWKTPSSDFSHFFNPETNTWSKLSLPYGFGFRATGVEFTSRVIWTGEKVFVMPTGDSFPALMAFFVPPDP